MSDRTSTTIGTSIGRFHRYATLRAAQRSLYAIRPLAGVLPADEELREARELLRAFGPDTQGGALDETRSSAIIEIDRRLARASCELRSQIESTPFSELRAVLPAACDERRDEVAALLDLCLDEADLSRFADLVDYLVTLLSTEAVHGDRQAASDPVEATPRFQDLCESVDGYDPDEVRAQVEAFDVAILELKQSESAEPVIDRMRTRKSELGPLRFVPDVLRKVVEYNLAVWNCLEDEVEAERTLYEVEAQTRNELLAEYLGEETKPKVDESLWIDPETFELQTLEELLIHDVGEQLRLRLKEGTCGKAKPGKIAALFDLTQLSRWESQAVLGERNSPPDGFVRSMVVVGLLLRERDEVEPLLEEMDLQLERFETEWVPRLDTMVQKVIADHLQGDTYQTAKDLARTRARYLHASLRAARRAKGRDTEASDLDPGDDLWREGEELAQGATPFPKSRRKQHEAPKKGGARRWRWERQRPRIIAAVLLLSVAWVGIQHATAKNPRSVRLLPRTELVQISTYLDSGYQSGLGHGTRFFGTVTDEWYRQTVEAQTKEALRIAKELRVAGVNEVFLIDRAYRLQTHTIEGRLIFPTPEHQ
jgi:hypothetical protein